MVVSHFVCLHVCEGIGVGYRRLGWTCHTRTILWDIGFRYHICHDGSCNKFTGHK